MARPCCYLDDKELKVGLGYRGLLPAILSCVNLELLLGPFLESVVAMM